jgi:hypothetical protein
VEAVKFYCYEIIGSFYLCHTFNVVIQLNSNNHNNKPKTTYKLNPDRDKQNWWHCPDNIRAMPPLSMKDWRKGPTLDRNFSNPYNGLQDTVIVIQVVQTDLDTIVGDRYLTGGNGTYNFNAFHFLTDDEVKKAVAQ